MLKPFKNKNKFIIQNRVNLWNNSQIIDSKKFKWRFFNQGLNKKQVFGNFYNRGAKQIRFLYKNLLRFHQLLRISHGKIKKKEIDRYFFKFKKYPSRFLFFINAVESRLDVALYRTGIFKNIFDRETLFCIRKVLYVRLFSSRNEHQNAKNTCVYSEPTKRAKDFQVLST